MVRIDKNVHPLIATADEILNNQVAIRARQKLVNPV